MIKFIKHASINGEIVMIEGGGQIVWMGCQFPDNQKVILVQIAVIENGLIEIKKMTFAQADSWKVGTKRISICDICHQSKLTITNIVDWEWS